MKFNEVMGYECLRDSYLECIKGTMWKDSVIEFDTNHAETLMEMSEELINGTYTFKPFYETTIYERGKSRLIRSQHVKDRIVHKTINIHVIKPLFEPSYIYDNWASQRGKGIDFALKRVKCHLNRAYRKWGTDFYILQMDIQKYFDSIPHEYVKQLFAKIEDDRMRELCCYIIDSYGEAGIGLGSEVCQSIALLTLDKMDHFIKEKLRVKEYGRYMDDCYLISDDKNFLKECRDIINDHLESIGLKLNLKKTHIFPIKNGFTFVGFNHKLTKTGHVMVRTKRQTVHRAKRKMRKLSNKIENKELSFKDAQAHYMSVKGHMLRGNCYEQKKNLGNYYNNTYIWKPWKEEKENEISSIGQKECNYAHQ